MTGLESDTILRIDPSLSASEIATRAYIAGLLDGEAYIGAKRRLPNPGNHLAAPKYSVALYLAMTDLAPVQMVARYCSAENRVYRRDRAAHYKTIYCLDIEDRKVIELLVRVRPFLICKARQADLALELAALRAQSRRHRTKVVGIYTFKGGERAGGSYRSLGLSDEFIGQCDRVYTDLLRGSPRSGCGARLACAS